MNKGITYISVFSAMGVGIAIGALCTKSYFEKKYRDIAEEEIESVKRTFSNRKEKVKDDIPVETNKIEQPSMHEVQSYSNFNEKIEIYNYSNRAESEHPSEEDIKPPYFIDIEDYDAHLPAYSKRELVYYMDDGTLLDEEENILSVVDTIGDNNLEEFENSLEGCCYIRNEQLQEDYEVSKIFDSYASLIEE